jgi:hypothetical protein
VTTSRQGRSLGKRHVEALLADYDDDPVAALTVALRTLTGETGATFDDLVAGEGFSAERRDALVARDPAALDALAAELNEVRTLR